MCAKHRGRRQAYGQPQPQSGTFLYHRYNLILTNEFLCKMVFLKSKNNWKYGFYMVFLIFGCDRKKWGMWAVEPQLVPI